MPSDASANRPLRLALLLTNAAIYSLPVLALLSRGFEPCPLYPPSDMMNPVFHGHCEDITAWQWFLFTVGVLVIAAAVACVLNRKALFGASLTLLVLASLVPLAYNTFQSNLASWFDYGLLAILGFLVLANWRLLVASSRAGA